MADNETLKEKVQTMAITIAQLEKDVQGLNQRLERNEKRVEQMTQINESLIKLTATMDYMAKEQKRQGDQLTAQGEKIDKIEKEPGENAKYYKRTAVTCIITGLVSAALGALIALLFK